MKQKTITKETSKFTLKKNGFAYTALGLAVFGALILFFKYDVGNFFYPKEEKTVIEKAIDVIDIFVSEGEEVKTSNPLPIIVIILGIGGLILSLISMSKTENKALSWSAMSLSIGVISWEFIMAYLLAQILPAIVFILILMLIGVIIMAGGF